MVRIGICITDARGDFVRVNAAFCELTGFAAEELIGRSFTCIMPADTSVSAEKLLSSLITDSTSVKREWRIRQKDGGIRNALASYRMVPQATGERFIVVTLSDITDDKATERRLRESEERFSQLVDNFQDVFWIASTDRRVLHYVSPAALRIWGLSAEAAMRAPERVLDLIHGEDRERVLATFADGDAGYNIEYRLTRQGDERWVRDRAFPVRDMTGNTYRLAGITTDTTERRFTAEKLRQANVLLEGRVSERTALLAQSEERYRAVVESVGEGIIVTQDGKIKLYNRRFLEMVGRSGEEVTTQPFVTYIHADDRERVFTNYVKRMRGEDVENHYHFRIVMPDGTVRTLEISAAVISWEGRPATLNLLSDATARLQAERELRRALEREKELSELKSRFVAMASHEFRTPLTAILSSVEVLDAYGAQLSDEDRAETVAAIRSSVERMNLLIRQVLLVGRAEAGGLTFSPAPLDVRELCERILREQQRARPDANLHLEAPLTAVLATVDEQLVSHILNNLIGNGIKYSPPGSPVDLVLGEDPGWITLAVRDRGIGIPRADQPRLFDSFHRGGNVGAIEGTGLGLAIVRQCVDLHDGAIDVASAPGEGSTFTVRIPRR